ncbi:MAG: RNA polymerase sigma factor [Planctomycetota bacterium]
MEADEDEGLPAGRLAEQESWLLRRARHELGPHLRSELDSRDLAQQAQLELLRRESQVNWRDPRALRGWLGRVVSNLAGQAGRRRRARASQGSVGQQLLAQLEGDAPTGSQAARDVERADLLREQLEALPATTRRVIELRFWEDCTHQQIAERLAITEQNARVHLHRGLERMRGAGGLPSEFSDLP